MVTKKSRRHSPRLATNTDDKKIEDTDHSDDSDDDRYDEVSRTKHVFEGKVYDTYQEMVDAKRKRNQEKLLSIGLIGAFQKQQQKSASQNGLKKRKPKESPSALPRRKSSRLAGAQADGRYIDSEQGGRFSFGGSTNDSSTGTSTTDDANKNEPTYYGNRINDGSNLSLKEARELCGSNWVKEESSGEYASTFHKDVLSSLNSDSDNSCSSVINQSGNTPNFDRLSSSLSIEDENAVAKVVPGRIYSVAAHPSTDRLLVCAGDKNGFVGFWNVDQNQRTNTNDAGNDGVYLFRFHTRPVNSLQFTPSGKSLLSSSYDGTVRWFDVQSETFEQIFATYDGDSDYVEELGFDMDTGYNCYTQYAHLDHRSTDEKCFFLSTSVGTVCHVDRRIGHGKVTFHEVMSEKKINSLSLHRDGYSLASTGLDCGIKIWDVRKLGDSRRQGHKNSSCVTQHKMSKSVNSAFFSPSGKTLVATTMAHTLNIYHDAHLQDQHFQPSNIVRHDNMTGRWLTTFMAQWHPSLDIFCVGSMQKPRAIDIYAADGTKHRAVTGEPLGSVNSRCCFHPRSDKLVVVGGNSSGRVHILR